LAGADTLQNPSGGKTKLGSISKRGDVTLRTLLIHGTHFVLRLTTDKTDRRSLRAEALKERSCANVAVVALSAKNARIIWAMLFRGTQYQVAS
jgi:transposase